MKIYKRGHGVFYTPRNIVNYMCITGIASYLKNNLKENKTHDEYKIYINELIENDIETVESLNRITKDLNVFLKKKFRKN